MKSSFDDLTQNGQGFSPFSNEAINAMANEKLTLEHWRWVDGTKSSQILSPGKKFTREACVHPIEDDGYLIPIDELQDADGVIRWSQQLLDKSWMTAELFYEFWELIHKAFLRRHAQ
jgi:hypothetical protein